MRHHSYLLILAIAAIGFGYLTTPTSAQPPSPTVKNILQCVGMRSVNTSDVQILNEVLEELVDVHHFLTSTFSHGSILELIENIHNATKNEQYQDLGFIKMWIQVNLRPLLSRVSREALSCLSTGNFNCETYQVIVKEISSHFSSLESARQKWIYNYFMYPFLARNSSAGCVSPGESSEAWLKKNFGAFSVMAKFRHFTTLNMDFNGLDVLHLLTPEQKAELLLHPEIGHLDNGTLSMVFGSLLTPLLNQSGPAVNSTPPKPGNSENNMEKFEGFLETLKPLRRFIKHIVSLTHKSNLTLKSHKLAQAILNFTLSEVAGVLGNETKLNSTYSPASFNSSLENLFLAVVVPVIRRFLPKNQTHIPHGLVIAFFNAFHEKSDPDPWEPTDECLPPMDVHPCAVCILCLYSLPRTVETLANIFNCVNLTSLTVENLGSLVTELATVLKTFIEQQPKMNHSLTGCCLFSPLNSSQRFPFQNFQDVEFTKHYFQATVKPVLPSISGNFLRCLTKRDFSCQSYQALVMALSDYMQFLDKGRQMMVYKHFIYPFLSRRRSADPTCISNTTTSKEWVMKNFGRFSIFAPVQDFFFLHPNFSALEAQDLLTPQQSAQLLARPDADENTINTVFAHFLGLQNTSRLEEFLNNLARETEEDSLLTVLKARTSGASTLGHHERVNARTTQCPNLQHYLDSGMTGMLCNITITKYACATLGSLTGESLADLLTCKLSGNMTYSKETWKLFLTKASGVLDEALLILTNRSVKLRNPTVLEVVGELRINTLSEAQLQTQEVIHHLFHPKLRTLMSSVSVEFLSCLSSKNFTCETFHHVMSEFRYQFPHMEEMNQRMVPRYFIVPFLKRNVTSDIACVVSSNGSEGWLVKNFQQYSAFVPLPYLLMRNPNFNPVEVLNILSPQQTAELLVLPHSALPDKNDRINAVFDHFMESQNDRKLGKVLHEFVILSRQRPINCSCLHTILKRIRYLLSSKPGHLEPVLWATMNALMHGQPSDCMLMAVDEKCPCTPWNESSICSGVHSPNLQHYLDSGMTGMLCSITITEYACASLGSLTGESLADLLTCKLSGDMIYSKETWKLFLTKASGVLDEALLILTNRSVKLRNPTVLEVVGELRINTLSEAQLQTQEVIRHLFHPKLRPLMSSVSVEFLSCLSSKNFTCETFHHVMSEFRYQFPHMEEMNQRMVPRYFIVPFLKRNVTSDIACVVSSNGSVGWLVKNFQQYSAFVPLPYLLMRNPNFNPLETLTLLSPRQKAELLVSPHPALSDKNGIINAVFDQFMESPNDKKLGEFLHDLVMLSRETNLSCDSYKTILNRLDQAVSSGNSEFKSTGTAIRAMLTQMALLHCSIDDIIPGCPVTPVNESRICAGSNRDEFTTMMLCNSSLRHYACLPPPTNLTSEEVAMLLSCKLMGNKTYSKETWKLFFIKVSGVLDEALLMFANMSHSLSRPSATLVFDVIGEILIAGINETSVRDFDLISMLFQTRLKPFLPFISSSLLSCMSTKNFTCETFQAIVRTLNEQYEAMDRHQRTLVYTYYIQVFLSRTDSEDPGCVVSSNGSVPWLQMNFGKFAGFLNFRDIQRLNRDFSVVEALPHLTVRQLAEISATPGQLETAPDVNRLMSHVPDDHLGMFFDEFSPAIEGRSFPVEVRSAMLQQVLDRANLSDPSVNDTEAQVWLQRRLRPLLANMRMEQVGPFFSIVRDRDCNISQEAVELLSAVRPTLGNDTESEVNENILRSLKEPTPLRCYTSQSFYQFLKKSFLDFPSPKLSTFVSLMPPNRQPELINSIPSHELGSLLRRPMFVDNSTDLCTVLQQYQHTPYLLEQEEFPEHVMSQIFPCVWPLALRSNNETEDLISSSDTLNASCLAFRKLVFVLASNYDFNSTDFGEDAVYDTIKNYLSTDGPPKCYSPTDPTLNSTAWFVNYFRSFIKFAILDDLNTFGSEETLQVFSVNPQNIELLSQPGIPDDVISFYTELIFLQDPQFNPTGLPPGFQCNVPGEAFSNLDENQTLLVLSNLNQTCTDVDPQISVSLAGNFKTIGPAVITALGDDVTGLSLTQITAAPLNVIRGSLKKLGSAPGWNRAQTIRIVFVLFAGNFKFNNQENLENLGTIISGVPSATISEISPAIAQQTASNPTFVANLEGAPVVVQQTFVTQIIKVNSAPQELLNNVPDLLATNIPRILLVFATSVDSAVVQKINKKKWKPDQAALFFDTVAEGTPDADKISTDVLQGFTCTRTQRFNKRKFKSIIRACRRRKNRRKVKLQEPQLTCMNNIIKDEKPQNFRELPSDMLLYYDYSNVQQATCRAYFTELGYAEFDVLSGPLSGNRATLLNNGKNCLGITGTQLNSTNVEILGNMCCTLDESYINDSDPTILEKLKNCQAFSDKQISAMETVLLRGTPIYGNPSQWNIRTLQSLNPLPMHFGKSFWRQIRKRDIRRYLRRLRKQGRPQRRKLKILFKVLGRTIFRRATGQCTVGNITRVTISDGAFPLGYNADQFDLCLSMEVVANNLAALAQKVDQDELQTIVLNKLHQAHPSGLSEDQVQILGPLSRVASLNNISKWNITTIDSLAALLNPADGEWEPAKSKAIIEKYLETENNTLGNLVLNAIGGPNLCSLNTSILKDITPDSLKEANPLIVSVCSLAKKEALFTIAEQAFNQSGTISLMTYQLIQPSLGGAPREYILRLSRSSVGMDVETLRNLNPIVLLRLNVTQVRQLLGPNLDDLKIYENETTIRAWIENQPQADLDSLGIGLKGGRETVTNTTTTTATTTTTTTTRPVNPTSGHDGTSTPSAHQLSLFVGLTFVVLQLLK
ncbi:hypothetical protein SKAU_G00288630 [Synaphobranchus kaupii]|uniref:Uncharacterized protein n=1 Tax=Synaphobranchus kaupii TaxID=118154 RepID=A0A9Q1ETH6_SYNKA|nr:hypothetical protein SKAU_G00288630 [Synaphobranchus kaupii]